MSLDLTSVRAKLARSAEHAQTIREEIHAWTQRNPYSLLKKRNADSTRFSVIVRINEAPKMLRWSLMFGDYLNNLRSVLDHLVYAIACHQAAPNAPAYEDKLMFPICDTDVKFQETVASRKLADMLSAPVIAEMERFQPYRRPHPELPPLLSLVRDLNNGDKHKVVALTYGTTYAADIGFTGIQPLGCEFRPEATHFGEVEDGTEVFTITGNMPAPDMDFDRHIVSIVVAVRHRKRDPAGAAWTDRTDIIGLMDALSREVRQTIYDVSDKVV